jgi:hypothetical protein
MYVFISLNVIILLSSIFSQRGRAHVQQRVYHESCKYACFGTQNSHAMRENKWQALCELKLTWVV